MLHEGAQGLDATARVLFAPAGTVDSVDCTRLWGLARLIDEVDRPDGEPASGPEAESYLAKGREETQDLRRPVTPWRVVTLEPTPRAFFARMQAGISWRA